MFKTITCIYKILLMFKLHTLIKDEKINLLFSM